MFSQSQSGHNGGVREIRESLRQVVVRLVQRALTEEEALALLLEHFPEAVVVDGREDARAA